MNISQSDAVSLAPLLQKLWPEHPAEELSELLQSYAGSEESAVFARSENGQMIGVALCSLRHDYVEGCETSPVGYLEGIYVEQAYRRSGIARDLVLACERWAKEKGCAEFASDCELTNTRSLQFHLGIGFEEANRIICLKKNL